MSTAQHLPRPHEAHESNRRRTRRRLRFVVLGVLVGAVLAILVYAWFRIVGDDGTDVATGARGTPIWERLLHLAVAGVISGAIVGLLLAGATEIEETPDERRDAEAAARAADDGRPVAPPTATGSAPDATRE